VATTYQVGQAYGRVTRVADFGAFVELEPGITGLIPVAETGVDRDTNLLKAFPIGSDVEVVVLEVDPRAAAFASARRPWLSSGSRRNCASTPRGRMLRRRRRWDRWPTTCAAPSRSVERVPRKTVL
jgi:transcriptional accessory protein Tex/SPT6